ncbi:rab3 GTPase-activating protein regulatory subunit [Chrysoperla carnea]|uniref:rab3 GTPase-activating protein regulatory subunit n=1 Tax=Chrysoperla carnea TaxID=189513 RepID=UPI001D0813E8|nr:rab3 GTPase-activating protein regulatory subunit [Chrysoperla carnea]
MSCQVKGIAQLTDIDAIRRCLFPTDDLRGGEFWLQNSLIAISPTGELIIFAREKKLVILSAKWDSSSNKNNFHVSFNGSLDNNDFITAVACVPIATNGKNSEVGPDWTCVIIGFSSGIVKFYTENCNLLAAEQFHNERVMSIKCQSLRRSKFDRGLDNFSEEIHVIYPTNICLINGVTLIQTLRSYRSELARVQAKGESLEPLSSLVNPKKWEVVDQTIVNDTAVVGLDSTNTFDHLLTAATCGGFYSKYRAMAPHNTLVLGVGAKPYVAFHYAVEGGAQPVLSDVAKAVASKLKAALPGWLTGGKSQSVEKTSQVPAIPAEPIGCRFGIHDVRRIADKLILSPDKTLAVISDSLGRIVLIDTHRGVCIRMWKGYREAEYSFVQIHEESALKRTKSVPKTHSKGRKYALFLVIYAPKKGIIEVWVMQQGPKIVTFSASKNSRLLYTHHGIMGLSGSKHKCNSQFTTTFIDPDGQIKDFVIPFHYALSNKNSKRARDIHLVKRLKQFLKSEDAHDMEKLSTELCNTCHELNTNELRLQFVEMIMNIKQLQPPILMNIINIFLEKVQPDDTDGDNTLFLTLCNNLLRISKFYMYAVGEWTDMLDEENGNINEGKKPSKPKLCDTVFSIPEKEMNSLQRLLDFNCLKKKTTQVKVTFKSETIQQTTFSDYLNAFELTQKSNVITLKTNVMEEKLFKIAEMLFHTFILSDVLDVTNFKQQILESSIETIDLVKLILFYWVQRPLSLTMKLELEMQSLSKLIYSVCQTTQLENICVHYNDISPFWKNIRDSLMISSNSFQALTAAILCRSVAQKLEYDKELLQSSHCSTSTAASCEDDVNWEKLSQDNCQWSILIGKLEDISLLNIILSSKPCINSSLLPTIEYDSEEISLKYITQKGKGSVTELVARWLIKCGVHPDLLIKKETENVEEATTNENEIFTEDELQLQESIAILKKQFPYSLEINVLLTNMAWEYIIFWQKKTYYHDYLKAGLTCIEYIPSPNMKHGLCSMIWNAHLKLLVENTSKLINKVGKLPKERLCRQDTGLSDTQLCEFINMVQIFLNLFLESLQQSYKNTEPIHIKYENLWDTDSVTPLTELVCQQNKVNYDLVHLHYQLITILQMITNLGVKHTKPVNNLLDSTSVSMLFTDLSSKSNVPFYNADTKLISSRTQFLMKVITSTIESVRLEEDGVIYSSEHIKWMSKCLTLCSSWGLDTDILKSHQVVQLFQNGFDSLALELLPSITDTSSVGSALLAIAGRRLLNLIVNSSNPSEQMAALSPKLTTYLDTLNFAEEWCAPSNLKSIEMLATQTLRCLSETDPERRLTSLLLEACSALDLDDS